MSAGELINIGIGALIAVIGWLVTRIDSKQKDMNSALSEIRKELNAKLDELQDETKTQAVKIGQLDVRMAHVEAQLEREK